MYACHCPVSTSESSNNIHSHSAYPINAEMFSSGPRIYSVFRRLLVWSWAVGQGIAHSHFSTVWAYHFSYCYDLSRSARAHLLHQHVEWC